MYRFPGPCKKISSLSSRKLLPPEVLRKLRFCFFLPRPDMPCCFQHRSEDPGHIPAVHSPQSWRKSLLYGFPLHLYPGSAQGWNLPGEGSGYPVLCNRIIQQGLSVLHFALLPENPRFPTRFLCFRTQTQIPLQKSCPPGQYSDILPVPSHAPGLNVLHPEWMKTAALRHFYRSLPARVSGR